MRWVTSTLWVLSAPAVWLGSVGSQRLAATRSYVVNMLFVACVSLVPCAAVPWNLYGLKIAETQSALKPILLFST
jgi:hypothetical protein